MNKNYNVQGFLKDKRIIKKQTSNSSHLNYVSVGFYLDEIQINATITSLTELDNFIKFLETSRPCFMKKNDSICSNSPLTF